MSYRLRIREPVSSGIKRIALEQIDKARVQWTGSSGNLDNREYQ
jgi:hypothetical protein